MKPSCVDCGRALVFEVDGFHFRCQDCRWKQLEKQIPTNRPEPPDYSSTGNENANQW